MLSWNQKWKSPSWESPTADPGDYVRDYANRVVGLRHIEGVWALVSGRAIDFYTLIDNARDVESQLHERELGVFRCLAGCTSPFSHLSRRIEPAEAG